MRLTYIKDNWLALVKAVVTISVKKIRLILWLVEELLVFQEIVCFICDLFVYLFRYLQILYK
jgi:hypothetical protein